MGYTVVYTRKVRTGAYEVMEIGLHHEFTNCMPYDKAFQQVRDQVEKWIAQESDRIIAEKGQRPRDPKAPKEYY